MIMSVFFYCLIIRMFAFARVAPAIVTAVTAAAATSYGMKSKTEAQGGNNVCPFTQKKRFYVHRESIPNNGMK